MAAASSASSAAMAGSTAAPARARTTPGRELGAAEQALERGVAGHMDDPKRERDLLARSLPGSALPSHRSVR